MTTRPAGRLGRRAPKNADAIRFGDVLRGNVTIPPHPATEDYLARLADWKMLGNDAAGDCVAVTWANMRRLVTAFLSTEVYPSQEQVWAIYRTQNSGFDPSGSADTNGPGSDHDQGMDIQTLLEYLVKVGGPDGVKAVAFAKVDFGNTAELEAALAIFGGVWTGIEVSEQNQEEFSQGQPWGADGDIEGRHSVLSGGYTPRVRFITWAAETTFTEAFVSHRVEEAWIVVWPEHASTEAFEAGIDRAAFEAAYKNLTGKAIVWPEPAPSPGPQPVPVGGDADHILADALRQWAHEHHVGGNEKAARAVQVWMSTKGL